MRITPLDIQQKQFPIKFFWGGFDIEEVYHFLEIIREEMEELIRENVLLKDRYEILERQTKKREEIENTLNETLITTKKILSEYKDNAQKQAALIVKEGSLYADEIVRTAQCKVVKIYEDIVNLKGVRRHFKENLRRLIESHLKMLDYDADIEPDLTTRYSDSNLEQINS